MVSPFVSSLRTSLGITDSNATVSPSTSKSTDKSAMLSMFSGLNLARDACDSIVFNVNGGSSAAKDLLVSKSTEKQAEAELAALQALRKQQQKEKQQQNQKEPPVTALSQALSLFDKEMNDRDSFLSRKTKRRQKSGKKTRGDTAASLGGRLQRQKKYQRL